MGGASFRSLRVGDLRLEAAEGKRILDKSKNRSAGAGDLYEDTSVFGDTAGIRQKDLRSMAE